MLFNCCPTDAKGIHRTSAWPFNPTHCPLSPWLSGRPFASPEGGRDLPRRATEPCPTKLQWPNSQHYRWMERFRGTVPGTEGRQHSVKLDSVTKCMWEGVDAGCRKTERNDGAHSNQQTTAHIIRGSQIFTKGTLKPMRGAARPARYRRALQTLKVLALGG